MYNSRDRVFQDARRAREQEEMLPSYVRGGGGGSGGQHEYVPGERDYYQRPPPPMGRRDDLYPQRREAAPPPRERRVRSRSPPPPPAYDPSPRPPQRARIDDYRDNRDDDDAPPRRRMEGEQKERVRQPRMNNDELDLVERRMRNLERVREERPRRAGEPPSSSSSVEHRPRLPREQSPGAKRPIGRSKIDELPGMALTSLMDGPVPVICSATAAPPRVADVIRQRQQQQQEQKRQPKDPLLNIDDRFDSVVAAASSSSTTTRTFDTDDLRAQREKMLENRRIALQQSKQAFEAGKMHPRDVERDRQLQEQQFMQHNHVLHNRSSRQVEEDKRTHYGDKYGLSMTELHDLDAAVPLHRFEACKSSGGGLGGGSSLHAGVTHFLKEYKRQHEISYRQVATDLYKAGIRYIWIQARGSVFYGTEKDYLTVMRTSNIRDALDKIEQ